LQAFGFSTSMDANGQDQVRMDGLYDRDGDLVALSDTIPND